jgi:hypothetical protein
VISLGGDQTCPEGKKKDGGGAGGKKFGGRKLNVSYDYNYINKRSEEQYEIPQ